MPSFDVDVADDDDPLFPEDDPLQFRIPHHEEEGQFAGPFRVIDNPQLPDDRHLNFREQPRTFIIESLTSQVEPDSRRKVRKAIERALDNEVTSIDKLMELIEWLGDQREAARQRKQGRRTRRPTGGQ